VIPASLHQVLEQLKTPNKNIISIPGFEYCIYLYWIWLAKKETQTNNVYNESRLTQLFSYLLKK
jgi:hypothetical protein